MWRSPFPNPERERDRIAGSGQGTFDEMGWYFVDFSSRL